jgi:hypothetical protein
MRKISLATLALVLALPSAALAQLCPNTTWLRQTACPEGLDCTTKGSPISPAEYDETMINLATLCAQADTTLTGGAGIVISSNVVSTDSGEAGFISSGALTCGFDLHGRMKTNSGPLTYCDGGASETAIQRYAAYGDSTGKATGLGGLTPERCLRADASGNVVVASADCPNGDTTGSSGGTWVAVFKSADESLDFTATFQDDNHLSFPVSASTNYSFRGVLKFNTTSGADIKMQITGPSSPTLVRCDIEYKAGGSSSYASTTTLTAFSTPVPVDGTGAAGEIRIGCILQNGANGGTVQIQWTQNNGGAGGPTRVYAGSYIEYLTP